MVLHVHLIFTPFTAEKSLGIDAATSDSCVPVPGQIQTVLSETPIWSVLDRGHFGPLSGCGPFGNYIHTLHTLQDIVRIDIGWLRSSTDRKWDCNTSWYNEELAGEYLPAWGAVGSATPWNHGVASFWDVQWGCEFYPCGGTLYVPQAQFHTDFLHCNIVNQEILLRSAVRTYSNGNLTVDFYKYGSCPGVYSATGAKQNVSRTCRLPVR